MPIYTRTGDQGQTGLLGGSRVPKTSPRVEAYGSVDEANAAIGSAKALADPATAQVLDGIQRRLFALAGELAADPAGLAYLRYPIGAQDITAMEHLIDDCMNEVGPQHAFVVPGDDPASAALHEARTAVRRAERRILTAAESETVRPELIVYVNRLSDALHALALVTAHRHQMAGLEVRVEAAVRQAVARVVGGAEAAGAAWQVPHFDLAVVQKAAAAAETAGAARGVPIVVAAVDEGGHLVLLHRMAGSLLASLELAVDKAYTAVALRRPTAGLKDEAAPGGELAGIGATHGGRIVLFGGGLPVFVAGQIAGGLGVSGGTVAEDEAIVAQAFDAMKEES